jgi:hypothetical protein
LEFNMPENWTADFMAMCCGLSLALALGWNVTAGAVEWRQLAQDLCIVSPTGPNATAERLCQVAAARSTDQSDDLALWAP